MARKPQLTPTRIAGWLSEKYGDTAMDLAPISGGFWSAAYTFRVGDEPLVLRFSDLSEGFAIDAAAMRFAGPDLPIPELLEVGEALGHPFAISRRHYGRFVEDASPAEAEVIGAALARLLAALRAVPSTPDDPVEWHDPESSAGMTWRDWLRGGLVDHPEARTAGWREQLSQDPRLEAIFRACERRVEELLPRCPERRDLVHGDLLHQNVLLSEDGARVSAVFSWKCSVRGDFLYDVAWCTLWGPWHPGIEAADPWRRTCESPDLGASDLAYAPLRHHCYELQIAASHFGWNLWTGNEEDLAAVADRAEAILERGPLGMARGK